MQMFEQLQEYLEPEYDEVTSQPPNTLESDTGNLCLTQSCKNVNVLVYTKIHMFTFYIHAARSTFQSAQYSPEQM